MKFIDESHLIRIAKPFAPVILRISISLLFLWFGLSQFFEPSSFLGYVPGFAIKTFESFGIFVTASTIVTINGIFETIFGLMLILGLFTRPAALLLFAHVIMIAISLGYNDIAMRDFAIASAVLVIFLNGPDRFCVKK